MKKISIKYVPLFFKVFITVSIKNAYFKILRTSNANNQYQ
jgi:hypothetical protein